MIHAEYFLPIEAITITQDPGKELFLNTCGGTCDHPTLMSNWVLKDVTICVTSIFSTFKSLSSESSPGLPTSRSDAVTPLPILVSEELWLPLSVLNQTFKW